MMIWPPVWCSRLPGLFVQWIKIAGPDGVHGPTGLARFCTYDSHWDVLTPGPTGFAITSLRSHNFVQRN